MEARTRDWVEVGATSEVAEGKAHAFGVPEGRIAVARVEGQLYAVQDLCSHDDGPLGAGELDGYAIVCPRHGARFDVRTGAVLRMPAIMPIRTFPVMEKDGKVFVAIEAATQESPPGDDW